jgi:hypothetical protein
MSVQHQALCKFRPPLGRTNTCQLLFLTPNPQFSIHNAKPQALAGNRMNSALPLLSVWIILWSCNNYRQPSDSALTTDHSQPDTAKPLVTTSSTINSYPDIFEAAFQSDTKVTQGDITYTFDRLDIGNLTIESGKLIACDPVVMHDAQPFTQSFPLGNFPVHLAMAKTPTDERVAFSRIVFSDKAIARWTLALKIGQKPISLRDTNFYCYGVDAGAGIFIDSVANVRFNTYDHSEWEDVFVAKAEKNGYTGFMHDFEGHNLATFSTGYGDGCYATFIGFDSEGNACQLLTDFGLVEWWKSEEKKQTTKN